MPETMQLRGNMDSVTRKVSKNNKDYAEISVGGQRVSLWDQQMIALAETCSGLPVCVDVDRKDGSKYWNVLQIQPVEPGEETPWTNPAPVASMNGAPATGKLVEEKRRMQLLTLSIDALSHASDQSIIASAAQVVEYAQILETYIVTEG